MSEEKKKKKDGKDGKDDEAESARDTSTPDALDPEFTDWMEEVFAGNERAQIFVVTRVYGRTGQQIGDTLLRKPIHSTEPPKQQEIVSISNDLYLAMQDEANALRTDRLYRVEAVNATKGGVFASKTIRVSPRLGLRMKNGDSSSHVGDEDDPLYAGGGDLLRKRAETVLVSDV